MREDLKIAGTNQINGSNVRMGTEMPVGPDDKHRSICTCPADTGFLLAEIERVFLNDLPAEVFKPASGCNTDYDSRRRTQVDAWHAMKRQLLALRRER